MQPIANVAARLGLPADLLHPYGTYAAKVGLDVLSSPRPRSGDPRLVLVSGITPTPAGEGKTTTVIGLGDALSRLGQSVCLALREPSLGPCFGVKGGGTGGGRAQLEPADRINLHFTGDFHAVTSAHNLLAAVLDNHLHFGNELDIDPRAVLWPRVLDMNDRALREIVIGLGGRAHGVPRQTGFDITAASELMAILCLAEGWDDLRARIDRTVVAFDRRRAAVKAAALGVTGGMLALLRDALLPNLVQTLEGTPALVHGGPFANIAHGCNSVLATRMALHQADWVVTEAGFGFDLGAEKFFDIKCRSAGLDTAAVVLVASVRALKLHGGRGLGSLQTPDPGAVDAGLPNLDKHVENIARFGERPVVALNRFGSDTDEEIAVVRRFCEGKGVAFAAASHFDQGGAGAVELARVVIDRAERHATAFRPLYDLDMTVPEKIRAVAQSMYGARDIDFTRAAVQDLAEVERLGYAALPVCIAKTQNSLSDDPKLRGRPRDFDVTVRGIQINAGAGFLVVLTGEILRMPGLPERPQALSIDLVDGTIVGLR
jgi:formate--tetrahydrofolate ligase